MREISPRPITASGTGALSRLAERAPSMSSLNRPAAGARTADAHCRRQRLAARRPSLSRHLGTAVQTLTVKDTDASSSQTVTAGATATYNLSVTGNQPVTATITCTGAPTDATCTPAPASVALTPTTAGTFKVSRHHDGSRRDAPVQSAFDEDAAAVVLADRSDGVARTSLRRRDDARLDAESSRPHAHASRRLVALPHPDADRGSHRSRRLRRRQLIDTPPPPPPATGTPAGTYTITVTATSGSTTANTQADARRQLKQLSASAIPDEQIPTAPSQHEGRRCFL